MFRSATIVSTSEDIKKSALTHIYFSLKAQERSRFHKVMSDEVWNLYKGSGIHIYTWDETDAPPKRIKLSAEQNNYCHIIPAGVWQAAEPISGEVLVGCSVAPGFDFADFTLIDQDSEEARKIISVAPELVRFIVE